MVNRIKIKVIGLALVAVFMLTACGQKLPLYMPQEPISNTTIPDSVPSTESVVQGKD